jgi:hypothetical protein
MAQDQIDPQDIAQILPQILGAVEPPPPAALVQAPPPPNDADAGAPPAMMPNGAIPMPASVPGGHQDAPPGSPPPAPFPPQQSPQQPPQQKDNAMMLQDAIKAVRARDAARRLGRDETEEECREREASDQASDAEFEKKDDDEADDRAVVEPIAAAKDNDLTGAESGGQAKKPQPELVTKSAMDAMGAAIKASVLRSQREIRDAERAVMPYVGELNHAFDSAPDVYAMALKMRGVDIKGVHPSAYQTLLAMLPKAGVPSHQPRVAMDAASVKGFESRFPEAKHIRTI